MPGTTPVYGFPYPEPTDLVADYPSLGQQLAEDIEAVLPTIGGVAPATPTSIANSGGTATLSGNTVTFSGVSSVSLNGCFSSTYDHYRILISVSGSSATDFLMRLRTGGTDNTTSNYVQQELGIDATTVAATRRAATTQFFSMYQRVTIPCAFDIQVFSPQAAQYTRAMVNGEINAYGYMRWQYFNATTQFDGFSIYPASGTSTGTVSVYGYKK